MPVEDDVLVDVVGVPGGAQPLDEGDAAFQTLDHAVVDLVGGLDVPVLDPVVEGGRVLGRELVDVGLLQQHVVVVEAVEVVLQELLGDGVVDGLAGVVGLLEQAADQFGHDGPAGVSLDGGRGGRAGEERRQQGGQAAAGKRGWVHFLPAGAALRETVREVYVVLDRPVEVQRVPAHGLDQA